MHHSLQKPLSATLLWQHSHRLRNRGARGPPKIQAWSHAIKFFHCSMHVFNPSSTLISAWIIDVIFSQWQIRWLCLTSGLWHYGGEAGRKICVVYQYWICIYIFKNWAREACTLLLCPPPNPSMFLTPMTVLLWLSECVVLNLWVLQYQVVEHMTVIFSSVDTRSAGFHH